MRTRRFRSMRTWVCRARFAADRVFAIDRMKRAATLLGLRISSTGNSEGESLEGENLARQTSTRVNKTGPRQDRPGGSASSRHRLVRWSSVGVLKKPISKPCYPSDCRSSAAASTLEGRFSKALKTRRGRLWPFSSPWSSSIELRLASSQAAGNPGERDTI